MRGDLDGDVYGFIAVQRRRIAELEAEIDRLHAVIQYLQRVARHDSKRSQARYGP